MAKTPPLATYTIHDKKKNYEKKKKSQITRILYRIAIEIDISLVHMPKCHRRLPIIAYGENTKEMDSQTANYQILTVLLFKNCQHR